MYRNRRIRIIVLVFLVLVGLTPSKALAEEYRVMTWNIADMDIFDGAGTRRVPEQLEMEMTIADVIRDVGPDILLFVEAPSFTELQGFVSRNNLNYEVAHLRQQVARRDFADGMAILSRIPVKTVSLVTPALSGTKRSPEDYYKDWSYRGLLVAEFEQFTVVGVHLKSPWDGKRKSYESRLAQARSILGFLDGIQGTVVVLGDFNDQAGADSKELEYGLPDTIAVLESELIRAPGTGITQKDGYNIDHIFVRDASVGVRQLADTGWELSDHRPVWADLSIPGR